MRIMLLAVILPILFACANAEALQEEPCDQVPGAFVTYVTRTLTDSTDLFRGAYPPATPLTCELLGMLQEELKDDSARHCFEQFSRKYWSEDPHATVTHTYIARHLSFPLAMSAVAHWNEDQRIRGLRELMDYRRMRPLVCTTKEGNAQLLRQDSAAVRYLIRVLETTPLGISGSENSTIHDIYIREVMGTLDLFTGQHHDTTGDQRMRMDMGEHRLAQAMADWRKWLNH